MKNSKKQANLGKKSGDTLDVISSLSHISIPTHIFRSSDSLAVLESIVLYLKDERGLSYHEIGVLLNRDERNIWTVYSRAKKKKLAEENEAQVH